MTTTMAPGAINRNSTLRLAQPLSITLEGDDLTLVADGMPLRIAASQLPLIDAFHSPCTIDEALGKVNTSTSAAIWMQLSATVMQLLDVGILIGADSANGLQRGGVASHAAQITMLDDRRRTNGYIAAIHEVVRPGDVVVDLGTGTGVLAIAAANAGAKKVYAIEQSEIADLAAQMFVENGVADRVELVRLNSTKVILSEPADVLVSEIVGNDPLAERLLEYTRDACQRLMKDDSRLLPGRIRLFARGVAVEPEMRACHDYSHDSCERWSNEYKMEFGVLANQISQPHSVVIGAEDANLLRAVSNCAPIVDIDLRSAPALVSAEFALSSESAFDGVLVHFELQLSKSVSLNSDPVAVDPADLLHWRSLLWILPRSMTSGSFCYRYDHAGTRLEIL